jgi:hypothetical protein
MTLNTCPISLRPLSVSQYKEVPMIKSCFITILLLGGVLQASETAAQGYLCIMEHGTGFRFRNGHWEAFDNENEQSKYLFKQDYVLGWKITEFGKDDSIPFVCEDRTFPLIPDLGEFIHCTNALTEVRLHKKSLRVLWSYLFGYWDGKDEAGNTPYIALGKCSSM